ncbi:efflux RND transporter periplasmic adaptor subunit [Rhodocyclus tenuis]|uniref:Macrolide-specific efflux system membrane fusion protein n=1 Tax=Rhodocyclus tenuis TaxID=1066 RepID=A0A840FZX7_RHOTE|nr:efflux RND transporter periplasmic adaptor subunit [Rhodocyclus tenuis]MBB4247687.1 macrolide-specific efflux system membrane fusion protein [Rhodocyclus tenuis]
MTLMQRLRSGATGRLVSVGAGALVIGLIWWLKHDPLELELAPVLRADIEATVTAIGTLQPRRYVDVGAQVSGQIVHLHVQPGSQVARGDLLVEIDPSVQRATVDAGRAALAGLRAQLAEQQAQQQLARQQNARQQELAQADATKAEDVQIAEANLAAASARIDNLKAQIDQTQATLKADEARLGYTRIFAPMAGTVVAVEAREGQTLNATYQTPNILRIADLSGMTVWTEVSEADIGQVKPGLPAYFTTLGGHSEARPRRWESRIRQILPAPPAAPAAAGTQSGGGQPQGMKAVNYTVLFDVDNPDGALMPQMTAQVAIVTARAPAAINVPLAAVDGLAEDKPTVRVLQNKGGIETRPLTLGVRNRHVAEVRSGLAEGEKLILGEKPLATGPRRFTW